MRRFLNFSPLIRAVPSSSLIAIMHASQIKYGEKENSPKDKLCISLASLENTHDTTLARQQGNKNGFVKNIAEVFVGKKGVCFGSFLLYKRTLVVFWEDLGGNLGYDDTTDKGDTAEKVLLFLRELIPRKEKKFFCRLMYVRVCCPNVVWV